MSYCGKCNDCGIELQDKEIIMDNGDALIDIRIRGKDGWRMEYHECLYALGRLLDEFRKPFETE